MSRQREGCADSRRDPITGVDNTDIGATQPRRDQHPHATSKCRARRAGQCALRSRPTRVPDTAVRARARAQQSKPGRGRALAYAGRRDRDGVVAARPRNVRRCPGARTGASPCARQSCHRRRLARAHASVLVRALPRRSRKRAEHLVERFARGRLDRATLDGARPPSAATAAPHGPVQLRIPQRVPYQPDAAAGDLDRFEFIMVCDDESMWRTVSAGADGTSRPRIPLAGRRGLNSPLPAFSRRRRGARANPLRRMRPLVRSGGRPRVFCGLRRRRRVWGST